MKDSIEVDLAATAPTDTGRYRVWILAVRQPGMPPSRQVTALQAPEDHSSEVCVVDYPSLGRMRSHLDAQAP